MPLPTARLNAAAVDIIGDSGLLLRVDRWYDGAEQALVSYVQESPEMQVELEEGVTVRLLILRLPVARARFLTLCCGDQLVPGFQIENSRHFVALSEFRALDRVWIMNAI